MAAGGVKAGGQVSLSVLAAARDAPDADAIVLADGTVWTWGEVAGRVASVADRLRETFGDGPRRVAFVAGARPGTVLTFLALWELGCTAVPLHARWTESERAAFLQRLRIHHWIDADLLASLERLPPRALGRSARAEEIDVEATAALIATSGSTGGPKAVALSYRAFLASARASASRLGWRDDDRWLASLPFAHVGGLSVLTRCLLGRKTLVVTPVGSSFDPVEIISLAARQRVTLLSVVPAMLRRLLDRHVRPPRSLRVALLGGAASPRSLVEEGLSAGWPLWLTYGLTEACSQVATSPAHRSVAEGSGARLLDGVEARIATPGGADGLEGPLEVRGDVLFSGYEPDGPRQSRTEWFRTGDLARLEGDRLDVSGRADHVIVTGGENVHPAEVEAALLAHPRVHSASVVGVDDERWGQIVTATVVADGVEERELELFLRERLAGFRIPRRWRFVEELPSNATGKIDRTALLKALGDAGAPEKKKPASR